MLSYEIKESQSIDSTFSIIYKLGLSGKCDEERENDFVYYQRVSKQQWKQRRTVALL